MAFFTYLLPFHEEAGKRWMMKRSGFVSRNGVNKNLI